MNRKNINRSIRALTLSLCVGFIFTHTTGYAAVPLGGPAGGPTPSNDLMRAPMLGAPGGGGDAGDAKSLGAHCFCKAMCPVGMTVKTYPTRPGGDYYRPYQDWKVRECSAYCNGVATPDSNTPALAAAACAAGCANGSTVTAFSAIGTEPYGQANQSLGTLVKTPAVYKTNHICPAGSDWNGSYCNQKSSSCVMPAGTPLISLPNNWGTIVNNVLWLNVGPGTTTQTLVTPAQCHF